MVASHVQYMEVFHVKTFLFTKEYQGHLNELQKVLHEKSKEANRLRDSFNTIRTTHDDLRKQVSLTLLRS